jgi:DNA-binding response OmpR family regulator
MPHRRHILLLDSTPSPDDTLATSLVQAGYTIARQPGLEHVNLAEFDLAIIVLAPGGHSPALLDRLCALAPTLPVLASTAAEDMSLRIEALQRGATDYLLQPCAPRESLHRIDTALHRARTVQGRWIRRGGVTLDPDRKRFGDGTTWTTLTPTEAPIFKELLESINAPVPKRRLRQCYPDGEQITDNAIEVVIHRLRQKVAAQQLRIGVLRGAGYVLQRA